MSIVSGRLMSVSLAAMVALGAGVFYSAYYGGINGAIHPGTTQVGVEGAQSSPPYDCPSPAVNSQLLCDILPANYVIQPRLSNAPDPYCLSGMSNSACTLLMKTQTNGVCDPNETPITDPLDCGCTGALVPDPFQGRCAAPATVCQLAQQQQAAKNGG